VRAKLGGDGLIVQPAVLAERLPRLCHRLDERNPPARSARAMKSIELTACRP
jgi:hypothetical protein